MSDMRLPAGLDRWVSSVLARNGYIFLRQTNLKHHLGRRMALLRNFGINLVIDVGANTGQYAAALRSLGYRGEIASFEPMTEAFSELQRTSAADDLWHPYNFALGAIDQSKTIHISANSISSSFLPMLGVHVRHAPGSKYTSNETVPVVRLDHMGEWGKWKDRAIWLKLDVQGYEDKVLGGATGVLDKIDVIQTEVSLKPLYSGGITILPMIQKLQLLNFNLIGFEPGFTDATTGELLQVDCIFRQQRV